MGDAISFKPFDASGRYYDLFYREKDYVAEVEYIDQLLKRCNLSGREILEFGSGTGKHGRLLASRGYTVLGIEFSAAMIARAEDSAGFKSQQGDIREIRLGRTFDAVLSLFHVVSYQISNMDVVAVFRRAAEHLRPGGLFVFDVWYSPAVSAQRPAVRVKRLADGDVAFTRIAEPSVYVNENRVDVNYTVIAHDSKSQSFQTFHEVHPMRHFSLPELDLLAEMTGLQRICAEEFLSGRLPSEATWGLCTVLRRI